jgi:pimeloyl-ACP methyl ester carboxylesterase
MIRALRRLGGLALLLAVAAPAAAVTPGRVHDATPSRFGLVHEDVTMATADTVTLAGWWFAAPDSAPVVVIAPRGAGTMADVLPAVREFQQRGFAVLTFDYRDFGPHASASDLDLRYVVFASRWVEDMVGALRAARERAAGQPVFAWGQDLGSAVTLAAAARQKGLVDAIAIEGVFRTPQEHIRNLGTSTIGDIVDQHRQLVRGLDEPISAATRLQTPAWVLIAGKDEVTPPAVTQEVFRRTLTRIDRWPQAQAAHDGAEQLPGYFDAVTGYFRRITPFVRP